MVSPREAREGEYVSTLTTYVFNTKSLLYCHSLVALGLMVLLTAGVRGVNLGS
jgi:hypothetical protein